MDLFMKNKMKEFDHYCDLCAFGLLETAEIFGCDKKFIRMWLKALNRK